MRYWDSSGIVPLLVQETSSRFVLELLGSDRAVATWWGTPLECVSALTRREREKLLEAEGLGQALKRLRELQESWLEVEPSDKVREVAWRLLRVHALRAADALQLAAAWVIAGQRPSQLSFVCADERLALAAEREGFEVVRTATG